VCFQLLSWGYKAHIAAGNMYLYDIVCDTGEHLLRIQVKSCKTARYRSSNKRRSYQFHATNGRAARYKEGALDIMAYVALDIGQIIFRAGVPDKGTVRFSQEHMLGANSRLDFELCLSNILPQTCPKHAPV